SRHGMQRQRTPRQNDLRQPPRGALDAARDAEDKIDPQARDRRRGSIRMGSMKALPLLLTLLAGSPAWALPDIDEHALCKAIEKGQLVGLWYRSGEGPRILQPRYLGRNRSGRLVLNGWQISGFSDALTLPASRTFRLDRTFRLEITDRAIVGPL